MLSSAFFSGVAFSIVPKVLRACGDSDEWPPFTYYSRDGEGRKTTNVTGYNVAYLQALLSDSGRTVSFTLLPWQRCLQEAKRGHYDIVLDGVKSEQREKDFLFPAWHYEINMAMVYRSNWTLPDLSQPELRSSLNVCGQLGYTYHRLKGSLLDGATIQVSAKTIESALQMVLSNRCDLLVHSVEVLSGFSKIGRIDVLNDKRLKVTRLVLPHGNSKFHLMVSRNSSFKEELLELLNKGISAMNQSGRARMLLKQHAGEQ
jgi:polar amino acid transport system substrate-binding protein